MSIRALDILRNIASIGPDTPIYCEDNCLRIGDMEVPLDSADYTKNGYEERVQRLLRANGISHVDLSTLERSWHDALSTGPVTVSKLLELASQASSTPYGVHDELDEWRQRIKLQLTQLGIFHTPEIPQGDPESLGNDHVELKPLLHEWPKELLGNEKFTHAESPFAHFPAMPIGSIWVDLHFVDMEDTPRESLDGHLQESAERRYSTQLGSSYPADFVLEKLDGLVALVGDPGVGKSTMLKWMARKFLLNADGRYVLPLFVPLRKYAQAKFKGGLLRYALKECGVRSESQQELWAKALSQLTGEKRENVVLLLDGLDEIPRSRQAPIIEEIDDIAQIFTTVVTSRPSGYPARLATEAMYEITELDPENISILIERWFEHTKEPPERAALLQTHLDEHPDIRRLARNPFLLTILCGVCCSLDAKGLNLPHTRQSLYKRTLEIMETNTTGVPAQKGDMDRTERLAYWLFSDAPNAPRYVFDSDDVRHLFRDTRLLDDFLKPRRFVRQWDLHNETLYFTHTTFHEFFTACHLSKQEYQEKLKALLEEHICDAAWHEVFVFLASEQKDNQSNYWQAFRQLANNRDLFGVVDLRLFRIIKETGEQDGGKHLLGIDVTENLRLLVRNSPNQHEYTQALAEMDINSLVHEYKNAKSLTPKSEKNVLRSLNRVQAMQASDIFIDQLLSGNEHSQAASYGAKWLSTEGKERLRRELTGGNLKLTQQKLVLRALGVSKDTQAVGIALELAKRISDLREVALESLALTGGQTAFDLLAQCTSQANSPDLQLAAISALGQMHELRARDHLLVMLAELDVNSPLAKTLLEALAEFPLSSGSGMIADFLRLSSSPTVRRVAADALEDSTEKGVAAHLAKAAQKKDEDGGVRFSALAALGTHGRISDTDWLIDVFRDTDKECDPSLRTLAFDALVRLAALNPTLTNQAQQWVNDALEEPDGELRLAAVSAIGQLRGDWQKVLLGICKNRKEDVRIREAACIALGKLKGSSAVNPLLSILQTEKNHYILKAAANALVEIDPIHLLYEQGDVARNALREYALKTGMLVYEDYIIDDRGRERKAPTLKNGDSPSGKVRLKNLAIAFDGEVWRKFVYFGGKTWRTYGKINTIKDTQDALLQELIRTDGCCPKSEAEDAYMSFTKDSTRDRERAGARVKEHISKIRGILRKEFNLPKKVNPLPSKGDHWHCLIQVRHVTKEDDGKLTFLSD